MILLKCSDRLFFLLLIFLREQRMTKAAAPAAAGPAGAVAIGWIPNVFDFFNEAIFLTAATKATTAIPFASPAYDDEFVRGVGDFRAAVVRWPELADAFRRCSRQHVHSRLEATDRMMWPLPPTADEVLGIVKTVELQIPRRRLLNVQAQLTARDLEEVKLDAGGDCVFHLLRHQFKHMPKEKLEQLRKVSPQAKKFVDASLKNPAQPDGLAGEKSQEEVWSARVSKQREALVTLFKTPSVKAYLQGFVVDLDGAYKLLLEEGSYQGEIFDAVLSAIAHGLKCKIFMAREESEPIEIMPTTLISDEEKKNAPEIFCVFHGDAAHYNSAIPTKEEGETESPEGSVGSQKEGADEGGAEEEEGVGGVSAEERDKDAAEAAAVVGMDVETAAE